MNLKSNFLWFPAPSPQPETLAGMSTSVGSFAGAPPLEAKAEDEDDHYTHM